MKLIEPKDINAYQVEEQRRKQILHVVLFISIVSYSLYCLLYCIVDFFGLLPAIITVSSTVLINLIAYFFYKRGQYNTSKIIVIVNLDISLILLNFFLFGNSPALHYYFIIVALIPLPLWSLRKVYLPLAYFATNIAMFIFIEMFSHLLHPVLDFPQNIIVPVQVTSKAIPFIFIFIVMWLFYRANELRAVILTEQKNKLEKLNAKLEESYYEIETQKNSVNDLNEELLLNMKLINDQRLKLEESNNTKNLFFSIISHDIKNPLSSIVGISELLNTKVNLNDEKKVKKFIEALVSASIGLEKLITNLLSWSRSQMGTLKLRKKEVRLSLLIQENITLIKESAENKGVMLKWSCEENLLLISDEEILNTVVRNILGNALKFSLNNGTIEVKAHRISNSCVISIKDNGVGMNEYQLENLFTIGSKISTPGTNNEQGTGLGLIVCYEFIQLLQGELNVTSKEGQGTMFEIVLPDLI